MMALIPKLGIAQGGRRNKIVVADVQDLGFIG